MLQRAHSSSISRTLVISLLLVLPLSVGAQQKKKMVVAERDTVPLFRGVAVSTDVVGPAQLVFGDYGQYQAALRVNWAMGKLMPKIFLRRWHTRRMHPTEE